MVERGLPRNREAAKQLFDFAALRWGNITPTDIDGFLEFHNAAFVYIEYKYKDTPLPGGQELAFKRAVDASSKPCILIHATHNSPPEQDIDGANAIVVRVYWKGIWYPDGKRTVKEVVDYFLKKNGLALFAHKL